jgi:hypothetical protein
MARGEHDRPGRPSGVDMRAKQDPKARMGVFKTLDDVPDRYRLSNYADQFRGEDTWTWYLMLRHDGTVNQAQGTLGKSRAGEVERCGRYFKGFMHRERDTHHALATPDDIEAFLSAVKDGYKNPTKQPRAITTTYDTYFAPVNRFYDWLQAWVDFPHRYHPVLMACANGDVARECWDYRMGLADKQFAKNHGETYE